MFSVEKMGKMKVKTQHWKVIVTDPKIRLAVQDIDQSLLDWTLSLTPFERLRCASNAARALKRFKRQV